MAQTIQFVPPERFKWDTAHLLHSFNGRTALYSVEFADSDGQHWAVVNAAYPNPEKSKTVAVLHEDNWHPFPEDVGV